MKNRNYQTQDISLIALRFLTDSNEQMIFCIGVSPLGVERIFTDPFTHPLFEGVDMTTKITFVFQQLEHQLLHQAGCALDAKSSVQFKEESFESALTNTSENKNSISYWIHAKIAGKLNQRKIKLVESVINEWCTHLFTTEAILLPSHRIIPIHDDQDIGALREGWRAEAKARLLRKV